MITIDRTQNGKYPETQQFKAWTDKIGQEAAQALGSFAGPASLPVILNGLLLTQGATNWQLSAGWIAFEGNIYYYAGGDTGIAIAQSLAYVEANLYFSISTITDTIQQASGGIYKMENGANPNVLTYGTASFTGTPTIIAYGLLIPFGQSFNTPWYTIGNTGQPAFQNNFGRTTNAYPRFRKDISGKVTLDGDIGCSSAYTANTLLTMFTLPSGFTPAANRGKAFGVILGGGSIISYIQIAPNGNVIFFCSQNLSANFGFDLSCISFFTD